MNDLPSPVSLTHQGCTKRQLRLGHRQFEPMVTLLIGGDDASQGCVIWADVPSGGQHAHVRNLLGVRWAHRYTEVPEMLTIAIQALQRALQEECWK
jgi:hypothetical protein